MTNGAMRGIGRRVLPIYDEAKPWTDKAAEAASCRRGCSHCCHIAVPTLLIEGLSIAAHLEHSPKLPELRRKIQVEFERTKAATSADELNGPPCVFLESNGDCGIYDHRPMACRLYFVRSPPSECSLEGGRKDVAIFDSRPVAAMLYGRMGPLMREARWLGIPHLLPFAVLVGLRLLHEPPRVVRKWIKALEASTHDEAS